MVAQAAMNFDIRLREITNYDDRDLGGTGPVQRTSARRGRSP